LETGSKAVEGNIDDNTKKTTDFNIRKCKSDSANAVRIVDGTRMAC
jgi:hypothetical protein